MLFQKFENKPKFLCVKAQNVHSPTKKETEIYELLLLKHLNVYFKPIKISIKHIRQLKSQDQIKS